MADTVDNPQIQKQLNDLLDQRKKTIKETNSLLQEQASIANEIRQALGDNGIKEESINRVNKLKRSIDEASNSSIGFGEQSRSMASMLTDSLEETDEGFEGLISSYRGMGKQAGVWGSATAGFFTGVSSGIDFLKRGLMGVVSMAATVVTGIFSISKSILSIPFKLFNAFVAEANRGGGGVELWQAYEDVRKQFGDFGDDMAQNVIKGARSMRGELDKTGLSVWRTAGYLYEKLNLIRELATEMGPTFNTFGEEISLNAEAFVAYEKGLGQSHESMKALAELTMSSGNTFEETLRTMTNFSTSLGSQFGISQKVIARDVGEMAKDLKHFGSVGVRQMSQLSVYARQLGTDFKSLLGVVDKFDNFEDAADSAARLAQAFGMNLDVMKMIGEQDPGARVDMIRKSFFRAGKSIDKLTRQERNYLATATNIEDQALNSVFAFENQAKSYDEVNAAGQTAEQQQITQTEAMQKLSASIERLVRSGQRTGGFFDRFVMGLKRGMRWTSEFWGIMRNIRLSLWAAEGAGRRVGHAFVKMFPGIRKFLSGVRDFFSPKKFRKMADGVVRVFRNFFTEIGDPKTSQQALGNLLNNFKKVFGIMINDEASAMGKIISGLKTAFKAIGQVVLSGAKIAIDYMGKFVKSLTDVFENGLSFGEALKQNFDEGVVGAGNIMSDIWTEVASQLGVVTSRLGTALYKLFLTAFDKVSGAVKKWWSNVDWTMLLSVGTTRPGLAMAALLFGPAFLRGAASALGGLIINGAVKKSLGALSRGLAGGILRALAGAMKFVGVLGGIEIAVFAIIAASTSLFNTYVGWKRLNSHVKEFKQNAEDSAAAMDEDFARRASDSKNKQLMNAIEMKDYEALKKMMKDKANLSSKERQLALEATAAAVIEEKTNIEIWLEKRKRLKSGFISGLTWDVGKEQEKKGMEARLKDLESYEKTLLNTAKNIGKEEKNVGSGSLGKVKPMKMGISDLEIVDQVKKIDPKKLEQTKDLFAKTIKPIIIGPGGIKETMMEITEAFANVDVGSFEKIADMTLNIASIPRALAIVQQEGAKISKDEFLSQTMSLIDSAKSGFDYVNKAFGEGGIGLSEEVKSGLANTVKDAQTMSSGLGSIGSIGEAFSTLTEDVSMFSGKGAAAKYPVVKAISKMIEAANLINGELSSLPEINIAPKLTNLGKALGIGGSGKFTLKREDFNVNVVVDVKLDPTKLANAVVDTGKVMKGNKVS